jgi:hypothetical protein
MEHQHAQDDHPTHQHGRHRCSRKCSSNSARVLNAHADTSLPLSP